MLSIWSISNQQVRWPNLNLVGSALKTPLVI
jgi:hypothetical protein